MKCEYKVSGAAGNYVPWWDESAGDVSSTYKVSFAEKLEISPGFGAPSEGVTPNGNTLISLEIPLVRIYTSRANAKAGIRTMRALKGLRLNLKMTEGADVDYWPSAVLQHMTANLSGQSVDFIFQFSSQDVTITPPS